MLSRSLASSASSVLSIKITNIPSSDSAIIFVYSILYGLPDILTISWSFFTCLEIIIKISVIYSFASISEDEEFSHISLPVLFMYKTGAVNLFILFPNDFSNPRLIFSIFSLELLIFKYIIAPVKIDIRITMGNVYVIALSFIEHIIHENIVITARYITGIIICLFDITFFMSCLFSFIFIFCSFYITIIII